MEGRRKGEGERGKETEREREGRGKRGSWIDLAGVNAGKVM